VSIFVDREARRAIFRIFGREKRTAEFLNDLAKVVIGHQKIARLQKNHNDQVVELLEELTSDVADLGRRLDVVERWIEEEKAGLARLPRPRDAA
jgi:hypothetical protein